MAARAIGTVTISFGLVSVPAKLYSATQAQSAISFNLLHKDCGSRLRQQYLCQKEGVIVERDDMVKGYEFTKDQYVVFTPEELKAMEEMSTQTVDITEFVPSNRVDPIYFDKAYFLAPDKGGEKAYRLLTEAMQETGRVALARYAARGKQYLVMLRATDEGIVMQQLLYADEVRAFSEVPMNRAPDVKEQELKLAVQLINQISSETFDPNAYEDDVKKRILEAIEKKVEGQEIKTQVEETGTAQIIDIMEALKASLERPRKGPRVEEHADERKAPKSAAPKKSDKQVKASKK
jgi:DNA end-binding protein Ku